MSNENEQLLESLITILVEFSRFERVMYNILPKLDFGDIDKYSKQFRWFQKKVEQAAQNANLELKRDYEGMDYSEGLPVTALNIDEFSADDSLKIANVIEPVIMQDGKVLRSGSVILEKK